jgi:ABC-type glycerol-3-phosphate transport system substrate-binding protein
LRVSVRLSLVNWKVRESGEAEFFFDRTARKWIIDGETGRAAMTPKVPGMKRRRQPSAVISLAALCLYAFLFPPAASAGGNGEKKSGGAGRTGPESSAKHASATISLLLSDDVEGKGFHGGADEFFRRTGVGVRFTAVNRDDMEHIQAMSLASGTMVYDAVVSDSRMIAEHGMSGRYSDLSEIFTAGAYVDGVLELAAVNGRLYGMPLAASWTVAFVDISILRDAGLDPGRPPSIWPEIVKVGRLLKSRSVRVMTDSLKPGESTTNAFFRWARAAGAGIWERRGERVYWTFDSRECLEAVLFLRKLLHEGLMDPGFAVRAEEDSLEYFTTGGAAVVPSPGSRQGLGGSTERHRFLSIPSAARNRADARAFVRFIASPEESRRRALEDGVSPVFRDLYDDPETRMSLPADAILASAGHCVEVPPLPQYGQISDLISDALQDILVNKRYGRYAYGFHKTQGTLQVVQDTLRQAREPPRSKNPLQAREGLGRDGSRHGARARRAHRGTEQQGEGDEGDHPLRAELLVRALHEHGE